MRLLCACLLLSWILHAVPEPELRAQPKAVAKIPEGAVPGYKVKNIEGFTLLVSDESLKQDVEKYKRKPLEALEMELKTLVRIFPEKSVQALRRVPIWVEWDEEFKMSNGRSGNAYGVYFGGSQLSLLKEGKHPLMANSVVVLSLKTMTQQYQPRPGYTPACLLLHELAHAVHHQVIGYENPTVKAAFQQAMERKLYDRKLYLSTNEMEYFAELTCAYLDRLDYYPNTREDLKKVDPVGYKLMETAWGKQKDTVVRELPSSEFSLETSLAQVRFGRAIVGETPTAAQLKGRIVVLSNFTTKDSRAFSELERFDKFGEELRDFGLSIVAAEGLEVNEAEIRKNAAALGLDFPILGNTNVQLPKFQTYRFPHYYVFGSDGKCLYRGDLSAAEKHARHAIGKELVAGLEKEKLSKAVVPLVDALENGLSPSVVLAKAGGILAAANSPAAMEIRDLGQRILAGPNKSLDGLEERLKKEPVETFLALERYGTTWKNTPLTGRINKLLEAARKEPGVQAELKARPALDMVRKVEGFLATKSGAFDPTQPMFQTENAVALRQLQQAGAAVKKQFPGTQAAREAEKAAARYGVVLP